MSMLRIESNFTSKEAEDWVYDFALNLFEYLDFEKCVGLVNGDAIEDELGDQVERLEHQIVDMLAKHAIAMLTR